MAIVKDGISYKLSKQQHRALQFENELIVVVTGKLSNAVSKIMNGALKLAERL